MSEQNQVEADDNRAFRLTKVDLGAKETTFIIKNGILGPMGNQLITTSPDRSAYTVLRKLGHILKQCGNMQHGDDNFDIEETDIDPSIVVGEI